MAFPYDVTKMKLPDFTNPATELKALSWKQPYLDLMFPPHDKVETRTWDSSYRGWVLMCSSARAYLLDQILMISGTHQFDRIIDLLSKDGLKMHHDGYALAVGYLDDVRPMHFSDEDRCFVKFHPDLFCHTYRDVTLIKPIPWKGRQRWSNVPMEFRKQIYPQ